MGFFDSLFGGGSVPEFSYTPNATANMNREAQSIYETEQQRYQAGLRTATTAFEQAQQALMQEVDPNLLFSQASDQIGARGRAGLDTIRSSLGARGLSPNSGAAQGLLSRLIFQQQGSIVGAKRDIALENQKQRQVNAAMNFANALNLAGYQNAPASGILYENALNQYEGNLAKLGLNTQIRLGNQANQTNAFSGVLGLAGGIAGGLIG